MAYSDATLPTWLAEECPRWCVRPHAEDDHPEDRRHQSTEIEVRVVRSASVLRPDPALSEDWLVLAHGSTAEPSVWVHVGQAEGRAVDLNLDRASAQRLQEALSRCLADLDG